MEPGEIQCIDGPVVQCLATSHGLVGSFTFVVSTECVLSDFSVLGEIVWDGKNKSYCMDCVFCKLSVVFGIPVPNHFVDLV